MPSLVQIIPAEAGWEIYFLNRGVENAWVVDSCLPVIAWRIEDSGGADADHWDVVPMYVTGPCSNPWLLKHSSGVVLNQFGDQFASIEDAVASRSDMDFAPIN